MITASEAYAIYEAANTKNKLKLWKTHAPELEQLIRKRAENGHTSLVLHLSTWQPMVDYIEALGYTVTFNIDSDQREIAGLTVDWSKS